MSKIGKLTFLAFGSSLLILLLLSFLFYKRINTFDKHIDSITHSSEILLQLEKANGLWMESSRSIRNYLLLDNVQLLDPYYESKIQLIQHIDSILFLTKENEVQQNLINKIKNTAQKRYQIIDSFILIKNFNENYKIEFLLKMENIANQYRSLYIQMRDIEELILKNRQEVKSKFEQFTPSFLLIIFIFTIGIFIISFWILIQNMKKRIELELVLQQKIVSLDQANKELENLTIVTSHHIQEPTRKIRNFSSMILSSFSSSLSNDVKNLLQRIEQNASHLQNLFINLVQYSNVIRFSEKFELIELNQILEQSKINHEEKILTLSAIITNENLPAIFGVRNHIQLLFDELVRNAIQFSSKDRILKIHFRYQHDTKNDILKIYVEDNGIGFPNEYSTRVFKLFEQLNPFQSEGKGIGLTMCSRIMANHGGSIEAYGEPGIGTIICLTFKQ